MMPPLVSSRFPYLPIAVTIHGRTHHLEALIDTGLDNDFALPAELVPDRLPNGYSHVAVADGRIIRIPGYRGYARLGNLPPLLIYAIALGDEPLIGLGIVARLSVMFDHGERVIVEA